MASKVNVKFVIILSAVLVVLALGAGGAYFFVKYRSGEHWVSKGDAAMAAGNYDQADAWYARAVGKEQRNVEWLTKWRAAREKKVPTSENTYVQEYQMYSQGILRNLALSQPTKIGPVREYLDHCYQECTLTISKGAWEFLASQTDDFLRPFEPEVPFEIRRYRGLALSALSIIDAATKPETLAKVRADLEAVLKGDPKDGQIAVELALWHRGAADRAKLAGDDAARKTHLDRSREVLVELLKQSPSDPFGLVALLTLDASDVDQISAPGKSPGEVVKIKTAAMDALIPRVKELCDKLSAIDAKTPMSATLTQRLVTLCTRVDPKNGSELAMGVLDHFLATDPENVDLLLGKAQLVALRGKAEPMIEQYQKIIDLKDRPVSLEGVRLLSVRNRARFAQANACLQLVAEAKEEAARTAALERAKKYRTQLANFVPEQAPELQFIDAKTALFRGDVPKARQLLAEFLKKPGDTGEGTVLEACLLMADIGLKSVPPEPGLARENLMRVLAARPSSVEVRMMLGGLEKGLQSYKSAMQYYRSVLDLDPDNKTAQEELRLLESIAGGAKVDDPVTQLIIDAQRMAKGDENKLGDEEAAMKLLEKGMEANNYDPRIVYVVAGAKFSYGDHAGAQQVIDAGLQRHPEDERLKDYAVRLKAANSLEGVVGFIKQAPMPEVDKQVALFRAYMDFGKKDEAAAALAEAAKAAPEDPRVIELQFQRALQLNDLTEAGRISDRAAKVDADKAGGDTYKARVQIAQKSFREAATTLSKAIDRGNATAGVYRLTGLVQAELGRLQDAMGSFRRAIDLAPTDLLTIKTYLSVLVKAGNINEAVAVARKAEGIGRADPEFLAAWLALEAQSGNPGFALKLRKQMYDRTPEVITAPGDLNNAVALASLYLDTKKWDDAKAIIEKLKKGKPSMAVVTLDARLQGDQGSFNAAKAVYTTYIGTLAPEATAERLDAYLAFGQFLYQRGAVADALAAYRQAARFQKPGDADVDLLIGDLQLNSGLFDDAEKTYRKVFDAKTPDPERKVFKRLIEAMNQQRKYTEVEAMFKALGSGADDDVEMMAQRASAARGLGNMPAAKEILDRAITKFPEEPISYLRRARMVAMDPAYTKDALADLATAIKLRPGFWQGLRTRAMIQFSLGKPEEALRDMLEAVERNPGMDELRIEYMEYLVRFGKESEAVDIADAALKTRPNDLRMIEQFAQVFARAGRWARSARFYKLAWEQLQNEVAGTRYANAMMAISPPPLAEIEAVLASPNLKVEKSWSLMLVRAALKRKQNKPEAAKADVAASFELANNEINSLLGWVQQLRQIYTDPNEALTILNASRAPVKLEEWMILARSMAAADDPKGVPEALKVMRTLRDQATDRNLKVQTQNIICDTLARTEQWEEALKEIETALVLTPDDANMANNAAAIMSEKLNRPKDAVKYAERARAVNPTFWAYTDTMASVYWGIGDKAQGVRYLELALTQVRSEVDKAKLSMKLAKWKLESGDKPGAAAIVDSIREMASDSPTLADTIKTEFQELVKLVEGAGK